MRNRHDDEKEALRWKRKFLDALEEQEEREKALTTRINTLRRGLLGVSLAGDGVDRTLDEQLGQLRTLLRREDREAGLDRLLEQIEASVLRLDTRKSDEAAALHQALFLSIEQLSQVPLSRDLRRRIKRFSRSLPRKGDKHERINESINDFLSLLRQVVGELNETDRESRPSGGFWSQLFNREAPVSRGEAESPVSGGTSDGRANAEPDLAAGSPETQPTAAESRPDSSRSHRVANLRPRQPEAVETDEEEIPEEVTQDHFEPVSVAADDAELELDVASEAETGADLQPETASEPASAVQPGPEDDTVEGELMRDRSGLSEPGFSYIADHVEPLLLRILENIHVASQSAQLVTDIEKRIRQGLNWYDFVAALEDIVTVISQSVDEERDEFQRFLNEMTDNLAHVHAVLAASEEHQENNRSADARLDASVREKITGINSSVAGSQDLDELKAAVEDQLNSIVSALDQFKSSRKHEDSKMGQEMHRLDERIKTMEAESEALRKHLLEQQEIALRDKLTGLPNRAAYDSFVREACDAQAAAEGQERRADDRQLCLAVCDIDYFKQVNDEFGHLAGDRVLKLLARELESRLRRSDFMARFGGEEFVIIMPATYLPDASHVLDKLRRAASQMPFHFQKKRVQVTASFGLAAWQPGDSPDTLFERADRALYLAKKNGRNRCEISED